ncbi:DegT/DnrJ/EryC1/StrS family aminotransferase [Microcoleus vaginatus PCC 9802]|uniref:DegT/DnrJ/EryC1/StrS family aminotransferase n=1 Tax=Microcoleus vaginatus TaxID=119532 RepID=UPI00020D1779|nr:Glutamine--scyllo-inositol transaminase [Microcoleus vaginatus FGP-2]UNU17653.1 DegT/DnrJ/EryC1/StrS family aminotransferase [Microcoleus vaginatus PCC 9802]
MERIPVAGPWITQKEIDYVTDAVTNAWYSNANIYHDRFEKAFANYVGRKYAISLPSCTSGLHLALLSVGVGTGDEVILPDITWIATSAPVSYVGATPVFADIDELSWCLSAQSFADRITPKTKAVIIVDLYGNMPDMDAIQEIADKHGIAVIEDAAEAIGSEYKGRKAGSFGEVSTFSFHGSKTLTTGEGGMLVTDSDDIYQRCLFLRDHGRDPHSKMFWNTEVAYKYKMSSMQAALGLAQLERIEELINRKREIFDWYKDSLGGFSGINLNHEAEWVKNTYWMVTAILDEKLGVQNPELIERLKEKGIDARPFFNPLSTLPAYQGVLRKPQPQNTVSLSLSPFGINLPSALNLTQEQVNYITDSLTKCLASP